MFHALLYKQVATLAVVSLNGAGLLGQQWWVSPFQVQGTVKLLIDKILFPVIRMARMRKNYRRTGHVSLHVKIVKRILYVFCV